MKVIDKLKNYIRQKRNPSIFIEPSEDLMGDGSEVQRDQWGSQAEFILACLGYAVGLGNVWRFPYLCGRNGGAAFLIPYLIMMIFAGFPVFYMELALGQYSAVTPALLFNRMAPIGAGLGACMVMIQVYGAIYYNMILAWALHYLFNTFRSPLRWSHCSNDFNTFRCYDDILFETCTKEGKTYYEGSCLSSGEIDQRRLEIESDWETAVSEKFKGNSSLIKEYKENFTIDALESGLETLNITQNRVEQIFNLTGRWSPAKEYMYKGMLRLSEGIESEYYGTPITEHVFCLLGAWVLVFLCLLGGTKSSGKAVYFTATFPYLILVILLCRGLSLEHGVMEGLSFFFVPNTTLIREAKVWGGAANQIFFSLSLGGGGLTTIASYNKFNNNLFRDTLIVVLGNCCTSMFAGIVIFPVVGYIAHALHQDVADVASDGIGLAFQVYPHAINRMAVPQLWAFLFFFMLVLLGIDTQLVIAETTITAIMDVYPALRPPKKKLLTVLAICVVYFLIGIVFTCPGGPYLLSLFDNYAGGWTLIIACNAELLFVMYIYGYKNFVADVRLMLGVAPNAYYKALHYPVNMYWIVNWVVITPLLLSGILIFNIADSGRSTYDSTYTFPLWADIFGWFLTMSCVGVIPFFALYKVYQAKKNGEPLRTLFEPTPEWGPADDQAKATIAANKVVPSPEPMQLGQMHNGNGLVI